MAGRREPLVSSAKGDGQHAWPQRWALAILLLTLGSPQTGSAACATPQFSDAAIIAGMDSPDVAVGDFNVDGKPDLVVLNSPSSDVSILLGTGLGGFGAATNFAAGVAPRSVAVGDFNVDGKPDLAVANAVSDDVSILLGTGTGSFGAATNFAAGYFAESVAVADFNADGNPDLAVVVSNANGVAILLGTGGTFGAATIFGVASTPHFVTTGDFNMDGSPDLVPVTAASVSILLGTGTGSFGSENNFLAGKIRFPQQWETSTLTTSPIWLWPTCLATSRSC